MSELTKCNYCTLQSMKQRAALFPYLAGQPRIEVILGRKDGWTTARYSDQTEPSAYFMKLTSRCVC